MRDEYRETSFEFCQVTPRLSDVTRTRALRTCLLGSAAEVPAPSARCTAAKPWGGRSRRSRPSHAVAETSRISGVERYRPRVAPSAQRCIR